MTENSNDVTDFGWEARPRNYENEVLNRMEPLPVEASPLEPADEPYELKKKEEPSPQSVVTISPSSSTVTNPLDDDYDPLVSSSASPSTSSARKVGVEWRGKKAAILQKYKTSDRMVITATFMKETSHRVNLPVDKVAERLEQLEEKTAEEQDMELSQQDYVNHIESLHQELSNAWDTEQRVKSLKIAIQCAKLLSDTSVIKFYPSKWVLVTEILDTFGDLVFQRIRQRSFTPANGGPPTALPENFTLDQVNEEARETCRNWFFKIASIRELLPRMFIEMSIMRCYNFIIQDGLKEIVNRICSMIRGIGDLLVATSARAYLARVAQRIAPELTEHLTTSFYDHLHTMEILQSPSIEGPSRMDLILQRHALSLVEYYDLFSPSIDWLIECLANGADASVLNTVLAKYRDSNDGLILNHVLNNFSPQLIAPQAKSITALIAAARSETFPRFRLFSALGSNLVLCPPPDAADRLSILNDVWSSVTSLENPEEYISVAEIFLEYTAKHFRPKQVNTMLGDILQHVKTEDRAYEKLQKQLQSVVEKILANYTDMGVIFSLDNFMPLMDLFQGAAQLEVSLNMLQHWERHGFVTSDPVIIGLLLSLAANVHDTINSLSTSDEVRRVSNLISSFIRQVQYGRDVEKQMNFFVDCRRAFFNLDPIKHQLILGVANLAMKTNRIVHGQHTKKSSAFVRACIAFCYITIPSMEDSLSRLHLYALLAQIALCNQSVHQAESLLKAAILIIPEVPTHQTDPDGTVRSTASALCSAINSLCSTLVAIPGDPEHGPFVIPEELITVIREYPWEQSGTSRGEVCLSLLSYFAVASQPELPPMFRLPKVETNAYLFSGDDTYGHEIRRLTNIVIQIIIDDLRNLGQSKDANAPTNRSSLAAALFDHTVQNTTLDENSLKLAHQMIELARSHSSTQVRNSINYLQKRNDQYSHRYH